MTVVAAVAAAAPPGAPAPLKLKPELSKSLPPLPPFPPVADALLEASVTGCRLPAVPATDSPAAAGTLGSPSTAFAPLAPRTNTDSARRPPALTIAKASDATPVINARVKIEQ
jgi:hypothetical protein